MNTNNPDQKLYNMNVAHILWLLGFVGLFGLHRLYLNQIGSGTLYFCTFGLCFVGQVMDLFTLKFMVEEANAKLNKAREINNKQKAENTTKQIDNPQPIMEELEMKLQNHNSEEPPSYQV
ncbi:hypothetical protein ABK040_003284 [Willaertia magna]